MCVYLLRGKFICLNVYLGKQGNDISIHLTEGREITAKVKPKGKKIRVYITKVGNV